MKKLFYLVLLSFVVNKITLAQNESIPVTTANFTVGVPYAAEDLWLKFYFTQENEMMSVKIEKAKVVIQKFNTKNLTQKTINTIKKMPKGFVLERMVEINKNYFLFYSIWDKENTTEQLFSQQIDWTTGAFKGDAKLILKVKGKIRGTFTKYSKDEKVKSKFDFRKSYDESKLMIFYRKRPEEKKDALNHDIIGLYVFSGDMEEIWGDEVTMPYTEKKMDNIGYSVDKVGNAYILIRVYNDSIFDKTAKELTKFNNKLEVLRLTAGSTNVKKNEIDKTPLDLENIFLQDIRMYDGPEDYMICTGLYTKEKNIANGAHGIFQFKIGRDGGLTKIYQYDFPLAMINKFKVDSTLMYFDEKGEKKVDYVPNLVVKNISIGKDESLVIVVEQNWRRMVRVNKDYVNYYYYYNGMVITKINAKGELAFMQYLSKRQTGMNNDQGGMSAAYMFDEERRNHYLVYLDILNNINIKENVEANLFVDGKGGFLNAAVVSDLDGSINKVKILDINDARGTKLNQFSVNKIFKTSDGSFGFEANLNKKEEIIVGVNLER